MSWVDRYTQKIKITFNGIDDEPEVYELFTRPSFSKELEFNYTDFQFVNIEGQLIKKRTLRSRIIPMEFYFIGEDNIQDAKLFERSLVNTEDPCIIEHPYYDTILAQIVKIKFDDSELNVTKVTCEAIETIRDSGIRVISNPIETVLLKQIQVQTLITANPDIKSPTVNDINTIKTTASGNYKDGIKIIKIPADAETYFNAFNAANSAVNAITASPILAMSALTDFINAPSAFEANVLDRVKTIIAQFARLRLSIHGLNSFSVTSKRLYEYQGASLVTSACVAAVSPLAGNYRNASTAISVIDLISAMKQQYQVDLDSIQGINGGNPDFYIPDFNLQATVIDVCELTTANLYQLALGARTEFSYVLTEDSNVILLTHRFYSLDDLDANIDEFISNNNLTYKEVGLGLKKGKTIVYYV